MVWAIRGCHVDTIFRHSTRNGFGFGIASVFCAPDAAREGVSQQAPDAARADMPSPVPTVTTPGKSENETP
jgi:hypothetical protein